MGETSMTHSRLTSKDVALCIVVRDDPDLTEWMDYHFSIGIGRIYVVDDNSTVFPVVPMIHPYLVTGQAVYRYVSKPHPPNENGERSKNVLIYGYSEICIKEYGNRHEFMGFFDADEFLVIKKPSTTLLEILEKYRGYGGLTLNWMKFGSSGHMKRPLGGIIKNYNKCFPDRYVKPFVNPKRVNTTVVGIHNFNYNEGYYAVDTDFKRVYGIVNPQNHRAKIPTHLFEILYLNHYAIKSYEDFRQKVAKGSLYSPYTQQLWDDTEYQARDTCETLARPNITTVNATKI
jgi:hypothetical protein